MKKIILFTLLLFCGANVSAQLVTFGPQISSSITTVNSHDFSSDESGTSINYGGFVRVNLLLLYFEGDLTYATTEFSVSRDGISKTDYKMSGSDLSLIVGFKLLPLGKLGNVRVLAGYDWKSYSGTDTNNDLNHFDTESNNSSVIAGVGVDVWKFTFDYRYLVGLTDIDSGGGETKLDQSCFVLGFKF
jgi:opacity protein-like surface antigen